MFFLFKKKSFEVSVLKRSKTHKKINFFKECGLHRVTKRSYLQNISFKLAVKYYTDYPRK